MYEVKTSSRHKKNNKLRWLATDINLNCYTLGVLSLMHLPQMFVILSIVPRLIYLCQIVVELAMAEWFHLLLIQARAIPVCIHHMQEKNLAKLICTLEDYHQILQMMIL